MVVRAASGSFAPGRRSSIGRASGGIGHHVDSGMGRFRRSTREHGGTSSSACDRLSHHRRCAVPSIVPCHGTMEPLKNGVSKSGGGAGRTSPLSGDRTRPRCGPGRQLTFNAASSIRNDVPPRLSDVVVVEVVAGPREAGAAVRVAAGRGVGDHSAAGRPGRCAGLEARVAEQLCDGAIAARATVTHGGPEGGDAVWRAQAGGAVPAGARRAQRACN